MEVILVTGLSGAGRSRALDWFEDQGYYCIDNIPPALIKNFIDLSANSSEFEKLAFGTDIRSKNFFYSLESIVDELRATPSLECKVVFVEAAASTIVKRYSETRRNHPMTGGKATYETIEKERDLLKAIRKKSDYVIDTTGLKVADLYKELNERILGGLDEKSFHINITSFGFKYGIPTESDLIMDMRFLPNPYYVPSLRKLSGNNKKVADYVLKSELAKDFLAEFPEIVTKMIPGYIEEGKYHLNVSIGCTGGHHRSVAVTNELARIFAEKGIRVSVTHRDVDLMAKGK